MSVLRHVSGLFEIERVLTGDFPGFNVGTPTCTPIRPVSKRLPSLPSSARKSSCRRLPPGRACCLLRNVHAGSPCVAQPDRPPVPIETAQSPQDAPSCPGGLLLPLMKPVLPHQPRKRTIPAAGRFPEDDTSALMTTSHQGACYWRDRRS